MKWPLLFRADFPTVAAVIVGAILWWALPLFEVTSLSADWIIGIGISCAWVGALIEWIIVRLAVRNWQALRDSRRGHGDDRGRNSRRAA